MRAIFLGVVLCSSIYAEWSAPVIVYSNGQANSPIVGIDESGNGVIVSIAGTNVIGNQFVRTNQLIGGIPLNQFDYTTTGITNPSLPNVSVNADGNAILTWTDFDGVSTSNLWASTLFGGTWQSSPQQLSMENVTTFLPIGTYINEMNEGMVTWSAANESFIFSVYANALVSQTWQGEQLLYTPDVMQNPYVPIVLLAGTPSGTALTVSVQNEISPDTLSSDYFNGSSWEGASADFVTDVALECGTPTALATTPNGTAIQIYGSTSGLSSIQINNGTPDISSKRVIYTADIFSIYYVAVGIDNSGNAIALWVVYGTSGDYTLYASRYISGEWEESPTILDYVGAGFSSINSPNIQFDAMGNAIAVWGKTDEIGKASSVYYDTYTQSTNSWATTGFGTLLSSVGDTALGPDLAVNSNGDAIAVWFVSIGSGQSIQAAYLIGLAPPQNLQGMQVKNKFLTQTDLVNVLNWDASPSSSVVSYLIFRDGVQIGTVSSSAALAYQDHNRQKGVSYTYEVTSANGSGSQSTPQTITIP